MLSLLFVGLSLAGSAIAQGGAYAQCGGTGWTGATTCISGWTCTYSNDYYSQCLPASTLSSTATTSKTSTSASTTSKTSTSTVITTTSTTSKTTSGTSSAATPSSSGAGPSKLVGQLPALGWNSWNAYGGDINETKIVNAAKQIVSLGLKDLGYQYVNIDDCWAQMARDTSTQRMVPDATKFPNGISGVATQVHALGLKLGIYSDAGTNTCAGYPGSLGFEAIDAATWTEWGVDYLKYDNCNVPSNWSDTYTYTDWYDSNSALRYRQMTTALAAQSRPILYSLCNWGNANVWDWGARVGHSWRLSGDSSATWSYITSIISDAVSHMNTVTFGAHGDMDMMEIGNGDLTLQEQRTHFAAWVFLKSPILLGTDLAKLSTAQLAIIKSAELLAFHQDSTIGAPAAPFTPAGVTATSPPEFYVGKSAKGTHVFVLNIGSASAAKTFDFASVTGLSGSSFKVHDMWTGKDLGTFSGTYSVTVDTHDNAAFLITAA